MEILVIGAGKMGEAIVAGLHKKYKITVAEKDSKKLQEISQKYGVKIADNQNIIDIEDKNVILCIKPSSLPSFAKASRGKAMVILSILAGTKLSVLKENLEADFYVRAMPNLSAAYQKSMTTITGDEEFKAQAIEICEGFGRALWVENEKDLDIATALAGSGPAFLALVAEALSDGAVKCGLSRDVAMALTRGLFDGFAPLLNEKHPAIIKDEVMSPGGTTAQGYAALEEAKTRSAFIKAIEAAFNKTKG